jgi:hypothetical protein
MNLEQALDDALATNGTRTRDLRVSVCANVVYLGALPRELAWKELISWKPLVVVVSNLK